MSGTASDDFEATVRAVTEVYGVTRDEVLGRSQRLDPSRARAMVCYVLTRIYGHSLVGAGRLLDRDHGSVHVAVRKLETRLRIDAGERDRLAAIRLRLGTITDEMKRLAMDSIALREVMALRERIERLDAESAQLRREMDLLQTRFDRIAQPMIVRGVA